jgi:protein-disulfide isomerase
MANRSNEADFPGAAHQVARRHRRLIIAGAVLGVIVALVGLGVLARHTKPARDVAYGVTQVATLPSAPAPDVPAIFFGASSSAKVTLTIYEDFRCPYCKIAETEFEPVYRPLAEAGRIQVRYHFVDLIDRMEGGTGSIQAGNAAACAQDAGRFEAYHDLLFADQPYETSDAYGSGPALISLARQVDGLDVPAFEECVNGNVHSSWVMDNYNSLSRLLGGYVATPYYAINGKEYQLTNQSAAAAQASFAAALTSALTTTLPGAGG